MNLNDYEVKHNAALRELAPECMVLLKKNGDFPIGEPCQIALYGNGARRTIKGGTGSGDVNSRFYYTAEQGLEEAGFTITSKSWLDAYDALYAQAHTQFLEDIKARARKLHTLPILIGMGAVMQEPDYQLPMDAEGDTAVYVLARNSGEGSDRKPQAGDVMLTETEIRDILECRKRYRRFMLVLNVGSAIDLTPVMEVENILILSQLGVVTGQALADVILGKSTPSGKLTTTWTSWKDYPTIGNFGDPDDTYYKEGIYVGYRYFDSVRKKPMFPFGFGLSYADFALGRASVLLDGSLVSVAVPVTNIGKFSGKETVQVYVSVPWGKLNQPYQTLACFGKTELLVPGDIGIVKMNFRMEDLAGFDAETASTILEKGSYIIRIGTDSRNTTPCGVIALQETVTVRQLSNIGGNPGFTDWCPEEPDTEVLHAVPVLELESAAFAHLPQPVPYEASEEAKKLAAALPEEDLIKLCLGQFKEGMGGILGIIGNAGADVAGAAGQSYAIAGNVKSLTMADGPAGLRLAKHYVKDSKGVHAIGSSLPADMEALQGSGAKFVMKLLNPTPKGKVLDQYCTAIPIGTALAQSWNLALCETCGDIVGKEMELFGVDLWLAPAMNIHRSILCGRNFEYCSEDPLISGLITAAITKGVQKHSGRGTTIKHFCCNNQETNRYGSNSHVSERALREIYLRGFEICIRQSSPAAMMTSYNLLNGVHTCEREDLMRTVVRGEWGYRGLIMTDWIVAALKASGKYRTAKPAPTIAAGNDLFMPGSSADYKGMMNALKGKDKQFKLTRKQLEACAANVIDAAKKKR